MKKKAGKIKFKVKIKLEIQQNIINKRLKIIYINIIILNI